ncbi:MAG: DUF2007 domain-containing protein [Bacteroidales bacterium]|nr:DUF2007 domain-containing protein [Bacteroidales bacterium]
MEDNLKKVFSADEMYKINIIQELLGKNEIKSIVLNQKGSSFLVGEIEIYVNEKDEKKALKLIEAHEI